MPPTVETTATCPYCGKSFYLPSDYEEHMKVAHFDFGPRVHLNLDADFTGDPTHRIGVARWRENQHV